MLYPLFVATLGTIPSIALILGIERRAERLNGAPLVWWRRLFIPLPIFFFLIANLDGIFSFLSYAASHPSTIWVRYDTSRAWDADRFFYPGFLAVALLPFLVASSPMRGVRLLLAVWGGHTLWVFFSFVPWLLATGVPLQH